jgi:hypothetical protein
MSDDKKPVRVSKAPPPITPIGSSSPQRPNPFDTDVKGPTNWKYWRHVETVEIWQALLLSLNIEPPGKGRLLDNAPGRTGYIPREYLGAHGLNDEFDRRWFLVGNRLETFYASAGKPRTAKPTDFLRLTLFAAWAIEFEWDNLPTELVALAQKPAAAPSEAPEKAAPPAPLAKDIKSERGCRRLIREQWPEIRSLYGADADGRQVLIVLTRNKGKFDEVPSLKTIRNKLGDLRKEKLIP